MFRKLNSFARRKLLKLMAFVCLAGLTAAGVPLQTGNVANAATAFYNETILFESTVDGYAQYRIPGVVVTGNGTVITYCEARKTTSDWADIDIYMRRSTDGGNTWSTRYKLVDGVSTASTINNPVMIAEKNSGVVHFLYCKEYNQAFYRKSTDHGATWSPPVEITSVFNQFKTEYNWVVIATGPGHGIQMSNGRLLVPVWLSTSTSHSPAVVATIYSDNGGTNWSRGEIIYDTPSMPSPNETTAVQKYDGSVLMNMRYASEASKLRAVSTSTNGSSGWSSSVLDSELTDATCFASLVRFTDKSEYHNNRILFSNANNPAIPSDRSNLTVKMSMDEGANWNYSKVICPTGSAYSDLAVSNDKNTIYCYYEKWNGTLKYHYLVLARFNLEWLTNGEQSLDPLSGPAPNYPAIPTVSMDEHWNTLSTWTTGGSGTKQINPAGQLYLYNNSSSTTYVSRKDISIPQSYALEFKAKIDNFTGGTIGTSPYPASLGTKVYDGKYRLMLDFRTDGIYAMTNFGAWKQIKAVTLNTSWHVWRAAVNQGVAEIFMDGVSQCKYAIQSGSYTDEISHWVLGTSADPVGAHVEYTRLYTGDMASGPVGDWRLDASSGTTAADSSPNANTGTVSGAVWAAGYKNNGLSFDGTNDYVDAGNKSNLQFSTGDFTAAAWIKTDTVNSTRFIFWYGEAGTGKPQWWVRLQDNNIAFLVDGTSNPSSNLIATTNGPVSSGTWIHVAVTRKGAALKIYINGQQAASGTTGNKPDVSSSQGLTLGQDKNGTTRYWDGMLDEVKVYDSALSVSEIQVLYNQ